MTGAPPAEVFKRGRRMLSAAVRVLVVLFLLASAPRAWAFGATIPDTSPLFGKTIADVRIEGVRWANDLRVFIRGAVRVHGPLTLDGLQRAVRVLETASSDNHRLSRVTVIAQDSSKGVILQFVVEPLRKVTKVEFQGQSEFDRGQLARAANLPSGTEFWPDTVTEAAQRIAALYFRGGWRDATVQWEAHVTENDENATILFSIDPGQPTTLVQLEFEGEKGLTDAELFAAFNLKPGDHLSLDQLDEGLSDLRSRLRARQYYRATVAPPKIDVADGRAVVEISIHAGPRYWLQVRGNRTFSESLLLSKLAYNGEDPLDATVQQTLARRMHDFYENAGFPDARVVPREVSRKITDESFNEIEEHLVTFLITEGKPLRIIERRFEGLHFFPEEELLRRIDVALEDTVPSELTSGLDEAQLQAVGTSGTTLPVRASPRVAPSEVFSTTAYKAACDQITKLYNSQGFLEANVGDVRRELIGDGLGRAIITVKEGPRTRIHQISIVKKKDVEHTSTEDDDDADYLPDADVQRVIQARVGDPVSFQTIEDSRVSILQLYKSTGHLFAEVDDREADVPGNSTENGMDVFFVVKAGKQAHVRDVQIKGNAHTDEKLIIDSLALKPGDVITPKKLQDSVRNLADLRIFTAAAVDIADPDRAMEQKTLVVQLREKPVYSAEVKGGLSLVDGPRVSGQFLAANLFGRNRSLSITAKFNYPYFRYHGLFVSQDCGSACVAPADPIERSINITFGWPIYRERETTSDQTTPNGSTSEGRILPIDQRYDLIHENKNRPAYNLRRFALSGTWDNILRKRWDHPWPVGGIELSGLIQSDVENDFFTKPTVASAGFTTLADQRALLLPVGHISLISVRPSLTLDARDDKQNPSAGFYSSLGLDFSKSFLSDTDVALVRSVFSISGYVPLNRLRRLVLALSVRMGGILTASGTSVIGTKRFFLGGTGTIRGFNEDGLIPEDVRKSLHAAVNRCQSLVSGATCLTAGNGEPLDADSQAILSGTEASPGGSYMAMARSEFRFGLTSAMDGAVFLDMGNLWSSASAVDLTVLRYAAGVGVRFPLPIGPAAFDVGFNLNPDTQLGEPIYRIHLSIGSF